MIKEIWVVIGHLVIGSIVVCVFTGSIYTVCCFTNQAWRAFRRINETYPAQINVPKGISIRGDGVCIKGCEIKSEGTAINLKKDTTVKVSKEPSQ